MTKVFSGILLSCVMVGSSFAAASYQHPVGQNLGVYGHIYKIAEPSFLGFIHQRLNEYEKDGRMAKMKREFIAHVRNQVMNPTPVFGVTSASKNTVRYFTPMFTLQHNIYNLEGQLLFKAGTQVNPLSAKSIHRINPYVSAHSMIFNEVWLFINGRDQAQVNWAKQKIRALQAEGKEYKIILVNGNLKKGFKTFGRVYFDQHGWLCHHFGITEVPTVLQRDGTKLKLSTVDVDYRKRITQ